VALAVGAATCDDDDDDNQHQNTDDDDSIHDCTSGDDRCCVYTCAENPTVCLGAWTLGEEENCWEMAAGDCQGSADNAYEWQGQCAVAVNGQVCVPEWCYPDF
jgi:hypothetical protein